MQAISKDTIVNGVVESDINVLSESDMNIFAWKNMNILTDNTDILANSMDISLAEGPIGTLATEGALWFTNLAVPDPMWGLPFVMCATNLLIIEVLNFGVWTVGKNLGRFV